MKRFACLAVLLLLCACYQADGDVVPANLSVRVDGVLDGRYVRPDGVEIRVAWNDAERLYDVRAAGTPAGARGGTARAMRVGPNLYLVQYMDATRLAVLASVDKGVMVLHEPNKADEPRLLKAHGLNLRPGPINALTGSEGAVRNFYKDMAASGAFKEAARMVRQP